MRTFAALYSYMKKRGFLFVGVIMVIAILILQREGMLQEMKSVLRRIAFLIENGAITVYEGIKPLVIIQPCDIL
jgi:hypothetical protein